MGNFVTMLYKLEPPPTPRTALDELIRILYIGNFSPTKKVLEF